MGTENRLHARAKVKWPVSIKVPTGIIDGTTENLSLSGAFIRLSKQLNYSAEIPLVLARIFHELLSRDQEDGRATGQPQGVGPEAYLNGTSQGPTLEDARKDGHIIRARCAPLSPASGFPVSWPQQAIHETSGLDAKGRFIP